MRVSKRTRTIGPNTVVASTTYESVMPKMARPEHGVHNKISCTSEKGAFDGDRAYCRYIRALSWYMMHKHHVPNVRVTASAPNAAHIVFLSKRPKCR